MAVGAVVVCAAFGSSGTAGAQAPAPVAIANPRFDQGLDASGVPVGWLRYGGSATATLAVGPDGRGLVIDDQDEAAEIGVVQVLDLVPDTAYEVTVRAAAYRGRSPIGAYVQLRFLPSQRYAQVALSPGSVDVPEAISLRAVSPADTTGARLYLYTHSTPTPKVLVTEVSMLAGVEPPPPPPPDPVPPVYERLKEMHLEIPLVADGRPAGAIVAPARYASDAAAIRDAIRVRSGVVVPIIADDHPSAAVPLTTNLVVIGHRGTNRASSRLYDAHFSLMDPKFPGRGGYAVRTLHDPYGNGFGAVLVGGSDDAGVAAAARAFADGLRAAPPTPGSLAVGWTMLTRLGDDLTVPADLRAVETWEASKGYGSVGYFGWNSISKRMAMYYMTGDPFHAREVIRLSFPDARAMREIEEIDEERIENKRDPLAGPYHYNALMLILYWDLIEESPVFTDTERLAVTNAFARRLAHPQDRSTYFLEATPPGVGSRHTQWSALSLFALARYFDSHYPGPVWSQALRAGRLAFSSLDDHAWISGENDNLFWYGTAIAPTLTYLVLGGHREPIDNGVLAALLRAQEALISGRVPDWALNYAAIDFLHKAAYLTGDGRWLAYRERTGLDTEVFRLGQSFWPGDDLRPAPPEDLAGRWLVSPMPGPMWLARGAPFDLEQSFQWMSFRSAADASGDFVLIDGYNGASRNPYHTYDILELRLGGRTVLEGYMNQVQTSADGMVEPLVPMDGRLLHREVVGSTAIAVGEVPGMPYASWRRTLLQRTGRYALIADRLAFRATSDHMRVSTTWQVPGGSWDARESAVRVRVPGWSVALPIAVAGRRGQASATGRLGLRGQPAPLPLRSRAGVVHSDGDGGGGSGAGAAPGEPGSPHGTSLDAGAAAEAVTLVYDVRPSDVQRSGGRGTVTMEWTGPVRTGDERNVFYLIAPGASNSPGTECLQVAPNAAALALPEPALAVVGEAMGLRGDLVVLAADHLAGTGLTRAGTERALVESEAPIDVEWDFGAGTARVVAGSATSVAFAANGALVRVDGASRRCVPRADGCVVALSEGRHELTGLRPAFSPRDDLVARLVEGRELRASDLAATPTPPPAVPELRAAATADLGAPVSLVEVLTGTDGPAVAVAVGRTVHLLLPDGTTMRRLEADDTVLSLRWWEAHGLLLAGCRDEQVIAFDEAGARRWVFHSEMDPAVLEAGKTYWYKSAPGHEGARGLYTGSFLDGEEQAFVGGACTLEILGPDGRLIDREPFFWGPGTLFQLLPKPDGSTDLLIGREPGDGPHLWAYNNRTKEKRQTFYRVPSGHTYVSGWANMARDHAFVADVTGDAGVELISEINGVWNRVTVWDVDGAPICNAQLGPGASTPARNVRDLDLADLDGDGRPEIVAATSAGLVVALDGDCRRLWSAELPSPPTVLAAAAGADGGAPGAGSLRAIVVGTEDGSILALDRTGAIAARGRVAGAPTRIAKLRGPSGDRVVLGTATGEVAFFEP